ncbi:uncharacterized protein BDR25DRAFT_322821 [Lindgomyces ingoldianus]|uniref:Uncharacterized protein n=1 Tax=Lindgomyces ingoldianus TaxID=673940 RepID=A0ACB6R5L9_9PLEO|nr:uncharacterized protein BDR25DRAFT_322821 [Lindgomyces ingoldianus]KAF2474604.1 hypothetical protein BDR25DRAFT_322821 [Lindgomyces ingoldianus]
MRPSVGLLGLLLVLAPSVLAQKSLPNLSTVDQPSGKATDTAKETSAATSNGDSNAPPASSNTQAATTTSQAAQSELSAFHLTGLPTIAGVGIPSVGVPDTAAAPFMQKSDLPDGTVFICVGAALGALGAAVLAWRGLVAWSLHRSVKRAAMAQNLADLKAMSSVPGKKRGIYSAVGASSTMSLDRLSAAPTGTSKPAKPFASKTDSGTPPKLPSSQSLFFSPTAGGATGLRDQNNRSSNYLPAGYYATGSAQPASGSPLTHVGGHGPHLSTHSLNNPVNRYSTRSAGISPPASPSLPPSRGYDRAPPSRDGVSMYNRNSVATLGNQGNPGGLYGHPGANPSQVSLTVPGGTSVAGGRAPSAYLEDLFENHGTGPRERFQ